MLARRVYGWWSDRVSRPGNSVGSATAESFNCRLRQEWLSVDWFITQEDAQCKMETWRVRYSQARSHQQPGWLTDAPSCVVFPAGGADGCGLIPGADVQGPGVFTRRQGLAVGAHDSDFS